MTTQLRQRLQKTLDQYKPNENDVEKLSVRNVLSLLVAHCDTDLGPQNDELVDSEDDVLFLENWDLTDYGFNKKILQL